MDRMTIGLVASTAEKRAWSGGRIDEALVEIRQIARGRDDLLVQGAGTKIGLWLGSRSWEAVDLMTAAMVLGSAGRFDVDELHRWIEVGQQHSSMRRPGL